MKPSFSLAFGLLLAAAGASAQPVSQETDPRPRSPEVAASAQAGRLADNDSNPIALLAASLAAIALLQRRLIRQHRD